MTVSAADENKIVLYNALTSPYGQRVVIALKLAGADYELVPVDMQDREWLKEIYPEAKVPVIKYGQEVIPESMVILEMLHELYPDAKLFPAADPVKKAKMKFVIRLFEDQVPPTNRQLLTNSITKETFDSYVETMTKFYRRLNGILLEESSSGPYYLGAEYSAVDIALAPFVLQVKAFKKLLTGKDYKVLDELPRLREFFDAILDHPIFKESSFLTDEKLAAIALERFKVTKNMFAEQ